ncbi:MAG: serine dehydratase subunit alpha family protein [Clostridia bacterium]|nr:serine dehydratase subunit alpha family protein [Clostridia bacterium]
MIKQIEREFLAILQEELIPAMGCTEPIALAYASAVARRELGEMPTSIVAKCSGNIVKNVFSVSIPNSGGMVGIESAVLLGAIGGNDDLLMEVLESVTPNHIQMANDLLSQGVCQVEFLDSEIPLHFEIIQKAGEHHVSVEVRYSHTNIVRITKDGETVFEADSNAFAGAAKTDRSKLNIENIKNFADTVDIELIRPLYDKQIMCNMAIAEEGMTGKYGLGIGKVLMSYNSEGVFQQMKAYAAAASEARMGGCDMPVIITSGSGNQGIASSVPVIIYAREKNIPTEKLYRALAFSSLLTIFQKEFIGKLSAFCGAVSATCAAGAAITYIEDGSKEAIEDTIDNTLANCPGVICDGAKVSCAAKIASCLDAAILGHYLAIQGKAYAANEGILMQEAEGTISCVGHIGRVGMRQTDKEIIKLMLGR